MPSIFSSRSRTRSTTQLASGETVNEVGVVRRETQEGGFMPFSGGPSDSTAAGYGFLSYRRHVVLGLPQVAALVEVICSELGRRGGITTPFIFSSLAMDLNNAALKRLINKFIEDVGNGEGWREEARFAGPHELGMCLRWGLARVVRVVDGIQMRGLISWERYCQFRDEEAALNYPPHHFSTLLPNLSAHLRSILLTVLSLLTRLTANSNKSGHTPPTLSPIFGPLLFGLGPSVSKAGFHECYAYYLRATQATEHLLLAFIRWQDAPSSDSATSAPGASAALAVPTRLKEWIKDYPSTLPFLHQTSSSSAITPRKGARTLRVLAVRRNVRMYSPDLVKSASGWAYRAKSYATGSAPADGGLAATREWMGITNGATSPPTYSDAYRKRMNMPNNTQPDTAYTSNYMPYASTSPARAASSDSFGEARFRSLTDLKWGEFENLGFGGLGADPGSEKKLQFDLTEGARESRAAKRTTLSWTDFSSAGFSRGDGPLSATLQFSPPLTDGLGSTLSLSSTLYSPSPSAYLNASTSGKKGSKQLSPHADLNKKLVKLSKALPPFGWDTEPVVGATGGEGEVIVEEAFFADCWIDLVCGGGWGEGAGLVQENTTPGVAPDERIGGLSMDDLERECNWAMIEFKSTSSSSHLTSPRSLSSSMASSQASSDPRSSTALLLFEEFVPLEYRQELSGIKGITLVGGKGGIALKGGPASGAPARLRLGSLFGNSGTPKKEKGPSSPVAPKPAKGWKPAQTLNGRPYVIGAVPAAPSVRELEREMEFEGMLRGEGGTKVISLSGAAESHAGSETPSSRVVSGPLYVDPRPPESTTSAELDDGDGSSTPTSTRRSSRFRMPAGRNPSTGPGGKTKPGSPPVEAGGVSLLPKGAMIPRIPKRGAIPAEYSTVEFQTRLASYSDSDDSDYEPGRATGPRHRKRTEDEEAKQRRRESRGDEAWVDILVGSQGRRMGGQEFESGSKGRTALRGGRSDPDLASMEVAQVLAAAGRRSVTPPSPTDSQLYGRDEQSRLHDSSYYDGESLQVDEIQTVPRPPRGGKIVESYASQTSTNTYGDSEYSEEMEPVDIPDDTSSPLAGRGTREEAKAQRRLGYFDIHPERKPPSIPGRKDVASVASTFDDDDPRSRLAYDEDSEDEPSSYQTSPSQPIQAPQGVRPLPRLPPVPGPAENGNGIATPEKEKSTGGSKTASLIAMYREKEQESTKEIKLNLPAPAPLQPSRLPVRTGSLPPKDKVAPKPIEKEQLTPPETETLVEPSRPVIDAGRASPARYIHGAPLHNVVEEEEED
ncbi:hypothetical protein C8J56DRAFT_926494 [Mycena floridula]|nr:hypothetical protein C8J56DRAFT_926494 [Mycena floridula]